MNEQLMRRADILNEFVGGLYEMVSGRKFQEEHEFDFSWTVVSARATGDSAADNTANNSWAPLDGNTGVVLLDIVLTPELSSEGLARDVVRVVQQARKDADLHVSDRIALTVSSTDDAVLEALRTHEALISGEVLATSYTVAGKPHVGATGATIGEDNLALQVQVLKA